jgi:predicted nucleic acid-binding protein
MSATLVDSNVIIDLLSKDAQFGIWSFRQIDRLAQLGDLVINQICFAETATYFKNVVEFERSMSLIGIARDDLSWSAAGKAGIAHYEYRKKGGSRDRILADFLIGSHANEKGLRLLTRDPAPYRTYFPELDIIAPDTHP